MPNIYIWQENDNFKSFLSGDEVVGRFLWSVGHSSELDQITGDSGPPLCRDVSCAQGNVSPVVCLTLDSFRKNLLLFHAFCIQWWLAMFWLFVQTHVSCIWESRKRFHWIRILLLLNIFWVVNWFSELIPIMEIVFTRH